MFQSSVIIRPGKETLSFPVLRPHHIFGPPEKVIILVFFSFFFIIFRFFIIFAQAIQHLAWILFTDIARGHVVIVFIGVAPPC